jgi:TM2 domain-containing membrane protein YozV
MNRTTDPNIIEHRLLELAYTTDAKITAPVLAYFAPCSIEDAERVLESLAARDRISMEIEEDGQIVYVVPDRQKLQPRREELPPSRAQPSHALARLDVHTPLALRGGRAASPGLAAVLSLALPGAGQVYSGHILGGILWFLLVSAGYALLLPGLFLHLLCIASAAASAHRLNSNVTRLQLQSG